uniref:Uncharacterized protein n=1 Tax=Xiphophorus couchianus TaxID=32473 RepID=A0A3B5MD78_9TELE
MNMPPAAATNLGYTPPDGGWGWTVVFATFISIGFSYAFPKSLTIYFKEIQEYVSATFTKIQQSLIKFALLKFSSVSRPVVMVDGLMVCVGMVIGSLGTSIIHLCVGHLLFLSKGFGLVFNLRSALTIIGTYFQVKKPLANGLAMVEGPVFLLYSFGWRGSFLVLGSIVLNCCVAEAAAVDIGSFSANPPSFVSRYIDISLFTHRGFLIYLIVFSCFLTLLFLLCFWLHTLSIKGQMNIQHLVTSYFCFVLMDLGGAHRFPSAVGLVTIIKCGPVLLGPHISGALVDVFKDYKYIGGNNDF